MCVCDFPLTSVSCFHIVSGGLRDVAFAQVQRVQALQNPLLSSPWLLKKATLWTTASSFSCSCQGKSQNLQSVLLVQYGSWKVWRLPRILWEVRSDLIVSQFLNHRWGFFFLQSVFLRGKEVEDYVSQAVISLIYHFFSSGLLIFLTAGWLRLLTKQ